MLNREDILSKKDLKREKVFVPEWGGEVYVSEMTGTARDEWEQKILSKDGHSHLVNARAKLVAATVVDEAGNRMFAKEGDIEALGNLSASALQRVCAISQEINGLTDRELLDAEGN
jgi:hypothetical protein